MIRKDNNNAFTSSSVVSFLLPLFIGKPLPNSLECMSAPYSTVTSSSMLLTNLQNSLSTSSVGTIYTDNSAQMQLSLPHNQPSGQTFIIMNGWCILCGCSYMDRHVEVICFEGVRHFPETLQSVLSRSLFKAECFCRFLAFLSDKIKTKIFLMCAKKKKGCKSYRHKQEFLLTSATHLGHRQLPLGGSVSGGSRQ